MNLLQSQIQLLLSFKRRTPMLQRPVHRAWLSFTVSAGLLAAGCGITEQRERDEFFTSGSREADQRAGQRMARAEQLAEAANGAQERAAVAEEILPLYDRLGGEERIAQIVDDFLARALADPRVNWERQGVTRGGFGFGRNRSVSWNPTPQNVATLKKHMTQFLSVATGGPPEYDGKDMVSAHADLRITNSEFDAAVGDLKASLDRLQVPEREQKELLAIIESTRPQVVTER